MVPVVSIVGRSGTGKTTLLEKLIKELTRRGYTIGTVKHDVHGFEMDKPGKDTYRHFAAGARTVLIASPDRLGLQKRLDAPLTLDQLAERYIDGVDVIITEGYKSADKPKIEVFRRERSAEPLCGPGDNRVALVTDDAVEVDCPKFGLADADGVAEFIQEFIQGKPRLPGP